MRSERYSQTPSPLLTTTATPLVCAPQCLGWAFLTVFRRSSTLDMTGKPTTTAQQPQAVEMSTTGLFSSALPVD